MLFVGGELEEGLSRMLKIEERIFRLLLSGYGVGGVIVTVRQDMCVKVVEVSILSGIVMAIVLS